MSFLLINIYDSSVVKNTSKPCGMNYFLLERLFFDTHIKAYDITKVTAELKSDKMRK